MFSISLKVVRLVILVMPRHVGPQQRENAVALLAAGVHTIPEIATLCSTTRQSVHRWKKNLKSFSTATSPYCRPGPPRCIEPPQFDALLQLLFEKPDTYLDEAVVFLWDEFRLQVSLKTVSKHLREVNWSKKKVSKVLLTMKKQLAVLTLRRLVYLLRNVANSFEMRTSLRCRNTPQNS